MRTDNTIHRHRLVLNILCGVLLLGLTSLGIPVQAQDAAANVGASQGSDATAQNADPDAAAADVGPVRMAWFKLVTGAVTWRADSGLDWSAASINLPIRQGAQVYAPTGARAEVQFDDGSIMHLGGGALVTFRNLYSDADGEFTQITLNDGLVSFRLRNRYSIYQVDTPLASVKAVGPARIRIGVHDIVEVGVKAGSAVVEGQQGKANINAVGFLTIRDTTSPFVVTRLPPDDSWEMWVGERDEADSAAGAMSEQDLPPDLYLAAPDLDAYGSWQMVLDYGQVWYPRVQGDWRPYSAGSWVWVDPFGWTWVSTEAWGWAPYHYGTWIHTNLGWGWVPGPAHQYWSPGVVSFFLNGDLIAWAPLCPEEMRYPLGIDTGSHVGEWSLFFSIGGCGVYYPGENHICEAWPWNTAFVNHRFFLTDKNHDAAHFAYVASHNSLLPGGSWIPHNAGFGGGSIASLQEFGSGHSYAAVPTNNLAAFRAGRLVGPPENGEPPSAGPANVRPAPDSLTPARSFAGTAPPTAVLARSTYRAAVSQQTASNALTRSPQPGAGPTTGPARTDVAHPQPGSTDDAVIRARSSVGPPNSAHTVTGYVVGTGAQSPPASVHPVAATSGANAAPPTNYGVPETSQRSQPGSVSTGGGAGSVSAGAVGSRAGSGGGGGGGNRGGAGVGGHH